MKIFNLKYIIFVFSCFALIPSCKKLRKEIVEQFTTEAVEKTAKDIVQENTEKTLKNLTVKELNTLDWDDLIKLLRKEHLNLSEALAHFDKSFQKKIGVAIQQDRDFYLALLSSNRLIDEFTIFAKNAPSVLDDISIFKYFIKCRDLETRFGIHNALGNITLKEEGGIIKFLNKTDNSIIGEFRNGIFQIKKLPHTSENLLEQNSILKKTLIPNSVYKIKGTGGIKYLYHVDNLGRFSKIEAKNISSEELITNILLAKENINLGGDWITRLKKIKQTSKGSDLDATIIFKYADQGDIPLTVKADVIINNQKLVSESFENLDYLSKKTFTTADNASLLNKWSSTLALSPKKKAKLLDAMKQDEELTKLIHADPKQNIQRWLNTRNHVDQSKVARTTKGRMVPNGRVYAGNTYYFNPHLNPALKARLESTKTINLKNFGSLTYDELIKLDKLYPEGIPFTKEGYPDFSKVAFKDKNGNTLRINIKTLSGNSKKDISLAETAFQKQGYKWEAGYTWHHEENSTSLIRVPTVIHQLVDHAGGMITHSRSIMETTQQAA